MKLAKKLSQLINIFAGVESVSMDKDQKLTVTGDIDPVVAVKKLRKLCHTEVVSVGPAKEPEKKKEEPKKEEAKKPAEPKKVDPPKEAFINYPYPLVCYPQMPTNYPPYCPYGTIVEEDPAAGCVIC